MNKRLEYRAVIDGVFSHAACKNYEHCATADHTSSSAASMNNRIEVDCVCVLYLAGDSIMLLVCTLCLFRRHTQRDIVVVVAAATAVAAVCVVSDEASEVCVFVSSSA